VPYFLSLFTLKSFRARPSWRYWRYCFQFSLRTLLGVTTLAAVACWWFLQPEFREEELLGKHLTLRRQVRQIPADQNAAPARNTGASRSSPKSAIDEGRWELWSQAFGLLTKGQTSRGELEGQWRTYYASGQKAAEGRFFRGLRVGVWRTWFESGQLESEVTYAVRPPQRANVLWAEPHDPRPRPIIYSMGSMGAVSPRPNAAVLGGGLITPPGKSPVIAEMSQRHGPAKTWYASGCLRSQGSYRNDVRHGAWSLFDEQGRLSESGHYDRGLREGTWTILRAAGGEPKKVEYVGSRPRSEYEALLKRLQADIASGDLERQVVAIDQLDGLGRHGVPLLVGLLRDKNDDVKLMALRRLEQRERLYEQNQPDADPALPADLATRIEPLISVTDQRVAGLAMLLLYRLSSERRVWLYPRLIDQIRDSREPDWQLAVLNVLYLADDQHRRSTFLEMAALSSINDAVPGRWDVWLTDLASRAGDAEELIAVALTADEARVRRFAVQVLRMIVQQGPYRYEDVGNNYHRQRFQPTALQKRLLDQALADPEIAVRQVAEQIDPTQAVFIGGGCF
jgi:hypothetical protein